MANPKSFQFDLPSSGRPKNINLAEEWYPNIQPYAIRASSTRSYDPLLGIRAVVIHATAGLSSLGAVSVIQKGSASFHWLVPDENEDQHGKFVWATCHEARAAWHVRKWGSHPDVWDGKKMVNHYSLGIEIVNSQNKADRFSNWQIEATARIVRYCWAKYPNLVHVVSHAKLDPTRRTDPGIGFPWDKFEKLVLYGTDDAVSALVASAPKPNLAAADGDECCM
ncbi:MAG: N-acetylmuramoyl-L-alanine amidase [Rhodobacteraceae bacterium]|nr:N-acetylmuramoyl-L-alanine amidase [Paracoccaceae bacterium]